MEKLKTKKRKTAWAARDRESILAQIMEASSSEEESSEEEGDEQSAEDSQPIDVGPSRSQELEGKSGANENQVGKMNNAAGGSSAAALLGDAPKSRNSVAQMIFANRVARERQDPMAVPVPKAAAKKRPRKSLENAEEKVQLNFKPGKNLNVSGRRQFWKARIAALDAEEDGWKDWWDFSAAVGKAGDKKTGRSGIPTFVPLTNRTAYGNLKFPLFEQFCFRRIVFDVAREQGVFSHVPEKISSIMWSHTTTRTVHSHRRCTVHNMDKHQCGTGR